MCNIIKCAAQYTVDLITNNISRMCKKNLQTDFTGFYIAAIRMVEIMNIFLIIK